MTDANHCDEGEEDLLAEDESKQSLLHDEEVISAGSKPNAYETYNLWLQEQLDWTHDRWTSFDMRSRLHLRCEGSAKDTLFAWSQRHGPTSLGLLRASLVFCVPSFVMPGERRRPNSLASLDGLRGYASLGVLTLHFTDTFCQAHNRGFGFDSANQYLFQLPLVHFFWNAGSLVACFFVLSGYVLSYKPLKLMHSGLHDEVLPLMKSAIFRRGLRLFVPMVTATFTCFLLLRMGYFDWPHQIFITGWTRASEDVPPKMDSFAAQFIDWFYTTMQMMYPLYGGGFTAYYDPHLFTIPTEFKASMSLFIYTIGVSQLRAVFRIPLTAFAVLYLGYWSQNELLLFFGGMFLCDVDLLLRSPASSQIGDERASANNRVRRLGIFWLLCFVLGLFLAGLPSWDPQLTPGYKTLMWLMPNWFRWNSIGCGLLVWSVRNSSALETLFTNCFAQYLGNISFSLYIIHGNLRRSLTYALIPPLRAFYVGSGKDAVDPVGTVMEVATNALITYTVAIWLADMWWRAVDLPSIRFARWVEKKTCVSS